MEVMHVQTDGNAMTTLRLMQQMVDRYYTDMLPYASCSLLTVFDMIKRIPFNADPAEHETLQRPKYTLSQSGAGGDCDCKCIALASYCKLVGIPYKFMAVRRPDMSTLHHVMCLVYIGGKWVPADPTYNFNALGRMREKYAEYITT